MAGHDDAGVATGHIGTNTPKFIPPRWGRPRPLTLLKRGCANSVVGLELADIAGYRAMPPGLGVSQNYVEGRVG